MKSRRYQRGEAMTVVVIILIVALIGALGFIAWQNFIKKDEPAKQAETTKQEDTEKKTEKPVEEKSAEEAYKGERVASLDDSLSFKVPNGWAVYRLSDNPSGFATPMTGSKVIPTYDTAQKPEITTVSGLPGEARFSLSIVREPIQNMGKTEAFTLNDGTKGTKGSREVKAHPDNIDGGKSNWYYRTYVFTKNGKMAEMSWSYTTPAGTDASAETFAFIDEVARTIEIK